MAKTPGAPGLYQVGPRGGRRRTKADLVKLAESASKPRRRTPPEAASHLPCGDPATLWGKPIPKGRRCQHKSKAGKACRNWALVGASRCWQHGGILETPDSPVAARWIADIEHAVTKAEINREIRTYDRETVQAVRDAAKSHGRAPSGADILEGLKALTAEDNGRAWRRWLAHLTAPAEEKRARKHKL